MAITFSERSYNKKYLFLSLVLIFILVILGLAWRAMIIEVRKDRVPSPVFRVPEIKINYGMLMSPVLKELQLFEEIELDDEEIGREVPFLPY